MPGTAGRLLVAEPMLGDANFDRTVVLMIEHNDDGAFGLVLNRATGLAVSGALPAWDHLATAPGVLHIGGPVEEQSGWCLARTRDQSERDGFVPVLGDLGLLDLGVDPNDASTWVSSARLYAGYSGWGAGQLEEELAQDAWYVVDADPGDPFLGEDGDLWVRILARQRGALSRLSLFPRHPSLN